jgi:hypothetical protein
MELRLTYTEISELIGRKAGRNIPVVYGGPHTVRIGVDIDVLFKTANIGLDLTVDEVRDGNIIISYTGGMGIDFMVRTALNHAKNQPGGDMIDLLPDNRIMLMLSKSTRTGSLLDHVDLKDIRFDEHYAIVEFEPHSL